VPAELDTWTWVAYIDETFNADSYWICAVLYHVDHVEAAKAALDGVVAKWAPELGLLPEAELHGSDLWHGSGAFVGVVPGIRRGIYDDALDALLAPGPRIILRGVSVRGLVSVHPHRLAWRYTVETIDELMDQVQGTALIVADEHAQMETALRNDIIDYANGTTGGWRPRTIRNVQRRLRFLGSHEHRLLQASDLVAYLHQRRKAIPCEAKPRAQTAREQHWEKVLPSIHVERLWTPPTLWTPP
jgi:hypothetical protein